MRKERERERRGRGKEGKKAAVQTVGGSGSGSGSGRSSWGWTTRERGRLATSHGTKQSSHLKCTFFKKILDTTCSLCYLDVAPLHDAAVLDMLRAGRVGSGRVGSAPSLTDPLPKLLDGLRGQVRRKDQTAPLFTTICFKNSFFIINFFYRRKSARTFELFLTFFDASLSTNF